MNSKQISMVMDEKREYRIITGGEDGMILWWNITVPFNPEAVVPNLAQDHQTRVLHVQESADLVQIKPVHQVHLTESAQFYGILVGPETAMFAQNDCILSFYGVKYQTKEAKDKEESNEAKQQQEKM